MHHAQVLLARGAWSEAEREVRHACSEMDEFVREHTGLAFFTMGEILRLTGDLDGAEEAFRQADEYGRTPQPGLALVHLARGDAATALVSLRLALRAEPWNLLGGASLLAGLVEVSLAADDPAEAGRAAGELGTIADKFGTLGLRAVADHAAGVVALSDDRAEEATAFLEGAWSAWRQIGASHEAARSRMHLGAARALAGDRPGGTLDLQSARRSFERLGARPGVEAADRLLAGMGAHQYETRGDQRVPAES